MKMTELNKYNEMPLYELQEVIQQYQSQPELLKLILTSKVEEDRRRAEEAKLRAKELDLYFENKHTRKHAPYIIPNRRQQQQHHHSSSISSLSSLSEEEVEEEQKSNQNEYQQRRHSAAAAMVAMGSSLPIQSSQEQVVTSAYPSPIADQYDKEEEMDCKPKRKREMQAITKIVETRDFPYIDNYFWKNNGNTVQKKTGCKSIYYKCSNSNKGCTVNKTVTGKPNGEYLIKYRGCHLPECGRVERIRNI